MKTTQLLDLGSNILRSKKIASHRIDSEVILSYILKISREKLLIKEDKICNENIIKFRSLISRRLKQEPVAYIIKRKEFRSEDFFVDKKSLIPRPETELLIDPIVAIFKSASGVIIIALFPPNSSNVLPNLEPTFSATFFPILVEPVAETKGILVSEDNSSPIL